MVKEVSIANVGLFKRKALYWASSFNTACLFDSNKFADAYSKFGLMIAANTGDELQASTCTSFIDLKSFKQKHQNKWLTGFFKL
ncbi:hypothetical protein [uncultured Mucilaginibacter sp.]|uniref:hypothetical protein n=1 Tax=uncultured Mucilaginibacter sp. TaxID=797541 RepID=UPI002637F056|nr:hypothetical protein [uncultured Mucilaginibacter sp.]